MIDIDQVGSIDFWREVKVDDIVCLSDPQAIEDSAKEGRGLVPRNLPIKEIRIINEQSGIAKWFLYRLDDEVQGKAQTLWLMAKFAGGEMDLRVYYEADSNLFNPGNRQDMLDAGHLWMFQQPADENNYVPFELLYTCSLTWDEHEYGLKGNMTLFGRTRSIIAGSTGDVQFATVSEYVSAESDIDDTELLILEIGGVDPVTECQDPAGGYISLCLGSTLNPNYLDILQNAV